VDNGRNYGEVARSESGENVCHHLHLQGAGHIVSATLQATELVFLLVSFNVTFVADKHHNKIAHHYAVLVLFVVANYCKHPENRCLPSSSVGQE